MGLIRDIGLQIVEKNTCQGNMLDLLLTIQTTFQELKPSQDCQIMTLCTSSSRPSTLTESKLNERYIYNKSDWAVSKSAVSESELSSKIIDSPTQTIQKEFGKS